MLGFKALFSVSKKSLAVGTPVVMAWDREKQMCDACAAADILRELLTKLRSLSSPAHPKGFRTLSAGRFTRNDRIAAIVWINGGVAERRLMLEAL